METTAESDTLREATVKFAQISLEDVQCRHRKEKKDLQAKIQALKKNAPKSDKKKRKEALEEISKLEGELEARHNEELKNAEKLEQSNGDQAASNGTDNAGNHHHDGSAPGDHDDKDDDESTKQPQRISKAQKRRDKKAREARQRDQDIKAAAEDAIHAPKAIEFRKIQSKLKERHLALHNIPSDGNCLYNAIRHQLDQHGLGNHTVQSLRQETANYVRANKDSLLPYMTNPDTGELLSDEDYEKYCNDICNTPAWGGQIELKALSSILKVPIEVLQAEGSPTILGAGEFADPPLVITYHRLMYSLGEHYNSTAPLSQDVSEADES